MALFSALLGLGTSLIGNMSASRRAREANQRTDQQIDLMRDFNEFQMDLATRQMDTMDDERTYRREIEELNRALAMSEREWQLGELDLNRSYMMEDLERQIERQIEMDREAARIQAFRLEELNNSRETLEGERNTAMQMLQQAQEIASGERDEDLRRFYRDRATAQAEREWTINQYDSARAASQAERDFDLDNRAEISERIGVMDRELSNALLRLGEAPEMYEVSPEEIAREQSRRAREYQSDVDRAADRVASVGEADVIRSGVDRSTTGTARRSEITRRIADEYQSARRRAYDDALGYITGRASTLNAHVSPEMQRRSAVLSEIAGRSAPTIQAMMGLPTPSSTVPAHEMALGIGSGVYDRQTRSANDYRAPIAVNSAFVDGMGAYTPGISEYDVTASMVDPSFFNVASGIFNPYEQSMPNPNAALSGVGSGNASILSALNNRAAGANDTALATSSQLGDSLNNLFLEWSNRPNANAAADNSPVSSPVVNRSTGSSGYTYRPPSRPAPIGAGSDPMPSNRDPSPYASLFM